MVVKVQAPKKPRAKKVATKIVHVLLDETGSMLTMKSEVLSGYNKYLDSLAGQNLRIALTKFDTTKHEQVHSFVKPEEATRLTDENYVPGALTNLYDAVAKVIRSTEAETDGDVLIVVMTDGEENSSKEITKDGLNTLIKTQEAKGWNFIYLGVSADAWKNEGAFVGTRMASSSLRSTGKAGVAISMDVASSSTLRYAASASGDIDAYTLTDEEKQEALDKSN